MSHEDCGAELRERSHQLLHGALKHVRVAALAATLVPLGALAARPAVAQDCGSGGCPEETPTMTATETPTDTPAPATPTLTFTWTPEPTETETPTPTETPPPDTPTETATATVTETATPADTATPTASHTAVPTNTAPSVHTATRTYTRTATPVPCPDETIRAAFNRHAIARGDCIWFSSVINPSRLGPGPTTIIVENQRIEFEANGQRFSVDVPPGVITFDADVRNASTNFDTAGNQWVTQVPLRLDGEVFASGVMVPVTRRLPGEIRPVRWSATFSSDAERSRLEWSWAAAVYTRCDVGYAALGVKPIDGNSRNPYRNADEAGTPETIKRSVIRGARGEGGRDYTGEPTRTEFVRPCD